MRYLRRSLSTKTWPKPQAILHLRSDNWNGVVLSLKPLHRTVKCVAKKFPGSNLVVTRNEDDLNELSSCVPYNNATNKQSVQQSMERSWQSGSSPDPSVGSVVHGTVAVPLLTRERGQPVLKGVTRNPWMTQPLARTNQNIWSEILNWPQILRNNLLPMIWIIPISGRLASLREMAILAPRTTQTLKCTLSQSLSDLLKILV